MNSAIIYEDKDIIVIHKPAGIATQTARVGQADVVSELKNYRQQKKEDTYIGVIHRLDQPVEGLLAFAKTQAAAKKLTADLQEGKLKKYYHALVPKAYGTEGDLTDYLIKDGKTNLSQVVSKETKDAKEARLHWKLIKSCQEKGQNYDLVEVEIFTGRHHQIRVQLSHANMPLLGDTKYGNEESCKVSQAMAIRQTALLASRLVLQHPRTGEELSFEVPFPSRWCIN